MNARDEATRSLWMRVEVLPDAPAAEAELTADTVIVGSGIAGLSAVYELAGAGHKVIVVDRGAIAGGMTSRTTAHLAPICDDTISSLIDLRGEEMAGLFQQSQEAAVDRIEAIVAELGIDCAFRRLDGFLFPAPEQAKKQLDKEFEAAQKAGATVEHAEGVPFVGYKTAPALRYPRHATFHPLKYLQTLTRAVVDKGGRLFANSPVDRIEASPQGVRVHMQNGARIAADYAVVATNSPISKRVRAAQQDGALPHLRHGFRDRPRHSAGRAVLGHGRSLPLRPPPSRFRQGRLPDRRRRGSQVGRGR